MEDSRTGRDGAPMITIDKEIPLSRYTSFGIGGPARFFCSVSTLQQLRHALDFALQRGLPYHLLGGGTNILASDSGFPGMVIKGDLQGVRVGERFLEAEGGVELMRLVRNAVQLGLSGVERLAGVPGTVGGAVRGNAGAYGACIGDLVREVTALEVGTMEVTRFSRAECCFDYRTSTFKRRGDLVILSARLELAPAPPGEIARRVEGTLAKRLAKNLQAERSAGSFFMNPEVADQELICAFERERGVRCRDGRIPAGWFIDRAGLRNRRVGGAMVSDRHANYLINTGEASARDVRELASVIKAEVARQMGVMLQEEACYLGF